MAVLKNGVFGGVSGKVGNKVYYVLNGRQVSRIVGRQTKPPTTKQLANRQAMRVIVNFLKPVSLFIQTGFGFEAGIRRVYPQNAAVSHNKSYALKGQYPDIEMDYTKALVSKGDMRQLSEPSVSLNGSAEEGYSLWFNWDLGAEDREWPRCNDEVLLLAYFREAGMTDEDGNSLGVLDAKACMKMAGGKRKEGQDVLELPTALSGRRAEIYIAVISEDRKKIANSQYLGQLGT